MEKARLIQELMNKPKPQEVCDNKEDMIVAYNDESKNVFGCKHYPRNCKIVAPCCSKIFGCRFCHDENSNHKINRHEVSQMFCMYCLSIQPIGQDCSNCGKNMGKYYCSLCRFVDNTPEKDIYHCSKCGICRIGKGLNESHYHCDECHMCFGIENKHTKHTNKAFHVECAVCKEFLHTSRKPSTVPKPCGHAIHIECFESLYSETTLFRCPICSKSYKDGNRQAVLTQFIDRIIQFEPVPDDYKNWKSEILCNDCEKKFIVPFHFVGHKCPECNVYNTAVTRSIRDEPNNNNNLPNTENQPDNNNNLPNTENTPNNNNENQPNNNNLPNNENTPNNNNENQPNDNNNMEEVD